ncbi:MAG: TAXI family TRAP transporter solute-binding subunit [Proteobacteria bacterium]|nr:TAXI family TRAP transporter solute-binding subunit [Pseudomonadota bacterium]
MRKDYLLPMLGMLLAGSAGASDVISIAASTKGTLFDQAGTAVAKVATNHGNIRSTLRNYASPNVFIPAIARGQVDFGIANQFEVMLAVTGQSYFEGRQQANLRAVAVLFPLQIAIFVSQDSTVRRIADLKGRRMPDGYVANKIILPLIDASLAADGLTRSDIDSLNVPGTAAGADAFISGRTEGFLMALRAPKVREANARHGIRALPILNTRENLAAIRQHMPVAYLALEQPGPSNPGILEPTWIITYDTLLFASTETSDDAVYRLTRTLFENRNQLIAASPAFRRFSQDAMAKDLGFLEYHAGAIRFYTEQGLWPPTPQ